MVMTTEEKKQVQLDTLAQVRRVLCTPPSNIAEEDVALLHWHFPDLEAAFNDMKIAIEAGELLEPEVMVWNS